MTGWTDAHLLETWERSAGLDPTAQAVALGAMLSDGLAQPEVAALPIGRRDALLFAARRRLFGPSMAATVRCPLCAQTVEFELDDAVIVRSATTAEAPSPLVVEAGEWRVQFRLPTSSDLLVALDGRALLARCVIDATRAGSTMPMNDLPEAVVGRIEQAMADADPGADIRLMFDCAACGHSWDESLDIVDFLGRELEAWAHATLREVAALGRAYGWTEPASLALTPTRRRLYLELAAS
jgi:hypothetical protein